MLKHLLAGLPFIAATCVAHADNCDQIRAHVESRYRAGGLTDFSVGVVDVGASAPGKLVGSCANGTRRIFFSQGTHPPPVARPASPATTPAKPMEKPILTECRDGTVTYGGNCKK